MKKFGFAVWIILLGPSFSQDAVAGLIDSADLWMGAIRRPTDLTVATLNVRLTPYGDGNWASWIASPTPVEEFIFQVPITPNTQINEVYTLSGGANFNNAVQLFTNNTDDFFTWGIESDWIDQGVQKPGQPTGYVYTESGKFPMAAPDFAGYNIDRFVLTILSFDWNPNGVDDLLDITVTARFDIEGTPVPEPATMLLLGTGLVGVAGAARRKKKNQA